MTQIVPLGGLCGQFFCTGYRESDVATPLAQKAFKEKLEAADGTVLFSLKTPLKDEWGYGKNHDRAVAKWLASQPTKAIFLGTYGNVVHECQAREIWLWHNGRRGKNGKRTVGWKTSLIVTSSGKLKKEK